jgi:hypothetical protein
VALSCFKKATLVRALGLRQFRNCFTLRSGKRWNLHSADEVDGVPAHGDANRPEHGGVKWHEERESDGGERPDQ